MRAIPMLLQVGALTVSAGALLLTSPASSLAAQDNPPCPFTNDSIVSPAQGSPVHGYADAGNAPGFEACEFGDFTMYRQSSADVSSNLGLAGLAQNTVLALPADVATQIGGLGAANAVADRLQRADVTAINVIGGCHYVAIATTMDGNGLANATTARQICDTATEVAYTSGILGITVTDRANHERASGANGEPCSGFP